MPEQESSSEPQPAGQPPETKKSFWGKITERFRAKKETQPEPKEKIIPPVAPKSKISREQLRLEIQGLEQTRQDQLSGVPEEQRELINQQFDRQIAKLYQKVNKNELFNLQTAEDYVDLIRAASPQELRALQLEKEYGQGQWGQFKAFLAGEHDFTILENGQVKRNYWAEFRRKAYNTIFNRRTALQAGSLAVIGVLTGGVGTAAGAATMLGSLAGRGGVEAWESIKGKEGSLRRQIAEASAQKWLELKNQAKEIHNLELSEQERNAKIIQLVEGYCAVDAEVMNKKAELKEAKEEVDKLREKWTKYGALLGLGTSIFAQGFLQGLAHLKDLIFRLDINGDTIYHNVGLIDGQWHFFYDSAQELTKAQAGYILGPEGYQFVSKEGIQGPIELLTQKGHAITSEGAGWLQYFWGAGKNLARDFGVLAATYLASTKAARKAEFFGPRPAEEITREREGEKEKVLKPLKQVRAEHEQVKSRQEAQIRAEQEKEKAEIERMKKYFYPGQIFGIKPKPNQPSQPFLLKKLDERGGEFALISEGKATATGRKYTWAEMVKAKFFETGLKAYDLNLANEKVIIEDEQGLKTAALEMELNYHWLERNKEDLKFFTILPSQSQKIFDLTGEEFGKGQYSIENIDPQKNTLWLKTPAGTKFEFYLPWFLVHKKQFHKEKIPSENIPPAGPSEPRAEPSRESTRESEKQPEKIVEVTFEEWEYQGKKHLSAQDAEGNKYRVDDKYKDIFKAGEQAKVKIIDTGRKDKNKQPILAVEPVEGIRN